MITAATILAPGTAVAFPSPRTGARVAGRVRSDQKTYASVEWEEEGGGWATCMFKGSITSPGVADVAQEQPAVARVECRQLSLFDAPVTPMTEAIRGDSPCAGRDAFRPGVRCGDSPRGMRLAEITWQGRHCCYLRDMTAEAVASNLRAGFEVVDLSDRLGAPCHRN